MCPQPKVVAAERWPESTFKSSPCFLVCNSCNIYVCCLRSACLPCRYTQTKAKVLVIWGGVGLGEAG